MKIYTRQGDDGSTGLFAGGRVSKDHARIEACGAVDELNAALGLAAANSSLSDPSREVLSTAQHSLFALGAELATPDADAAGTRMVTSAMVAELETAIDRLDSKLPPLTEFILPGGSEGAALLHVARGVCRRAERRVVTLCHQEESVSPEIIAYLNRLSDLLFVMARAENQTSGHADIAWRKP